MSSETKEHKHRGGSVHTLDRKSTQEEYDAAERWIQYIRFPVGILSQSKKNVYTPMQLERLDAAWASSRRGDVTITQGPPDGIIEPPSSWCIIL